MLKKSYCKEDPRKRKVIEGELKDVVKKKREKTNETRKRQREKQVRQTSSKIEQQSSIKEVPERKPRKLRKTC